MSVLPDKNVMCPATGFSKSCRAIITEFECPKFVQLLGMDPQTGEQKNQHGCVDSFLPLLMLENSRMQRETGAAIESFRNEMVLLNRPLQGLAVLPAKPPSQGD